MTSTGIGIRESNCTMIMTFPHEPFTGTTATALGITKRRLSDAVVQGLLVRLFRNVYVRAELELTTEMRARAAKLVISQYSVVCDRTAAWIWGVDSFSYAELDQSPPLELFTLRGHRAVRRPEILSGQRDLQPADWTQVEGVRVTTPARTALDLGCRLHRREALAAMDAIARACGLQASDLMRLLPRYARRRGVVQLRELLPLVDPRAESSGESWTRLELHDHGLPRPEVNWWVYVDGNPKYRLDLAYPKARIAIEYDGELFHTSIDDIEADRTRRDWLRRHGWTVIVVTKHSFRGDAIARWIDAVREALADAQRPQLRFTRPRAATRPSRGGNSTVPGRQLDR